MKKTSILTFVAALFSVALVSANTTTNNPDSTISEQLKEILSQNAIDVDTKDATARVLFKVNNEGEIEVLRVATERKDIKWFLNRKLEGKKLSLDNSAYGEVFVVDVRVTS